MFEFLLALFGGLYYGGKMLNEKAKLREYDKSVEEKTNRRNSMRTRLCTSHQEEELIKKYILSGAHFEEICEKYQEDFRYVFGINWKEKIRIPYRPLVLTPKVYNSPMYSFSVPTNHIYWVYRLILASKGKVDNGMISFGYGMPPTKERDMCVKFAQRIEQRLINAGASDIRFVLEQKYNDDIKDDSIKIESLCDYKSRRLW